LFILDNSASPQFNIEVKKKCSSNFFVLAYLSKLVEQIILEAPSNLILDNKNDSELQMLISQYDGLKLLYDLPKSDQKIITNMISDKVSKDTIKTLENILSKKSFEKCSLNDKNKNNIVIIKINKYLNFSCLIFSLRIVKLCIFI
jgi:hypothetical protein